MRRAVAPLGILVGALLVACAAEPEPVTVRPVAERFAVFAVVRSESSASSEITEEVRVEGFFARHWGLSRLGTVEVVGLPDLGDPELYTLESGRCRVVERSLAVSLGGDEHEAFVDLLDGGKVRLSIGENGNFRLVRRPVSELHASVSGVTYEGLLAFSSLSSPLDGGRRGPVRVSLEGRGSPDIGSFRVERALPVLPTIQEVNGEPVTSDYAGIDWTDELMVTWATPREPQADTQLLVSLEALQFDRRVELRCRSRDSGSVALPVDGVAAVARLATSEATVRLVVQRVVRVPFVASGLHEGHAIFASRSSVLLK